MNLVQDIYDGIEPKPLVIGPGGFYDTAWFAEFLNKSGSSLNVATHHIYNLGPGIIIGRIYLFHNPSTSVM